MKERGFRYIRGKLKKGVEIITKYLFPIFGYASGTAVASGCYRRYSGVLGLDITTYGFPLGWLERTRKVVYPPLPDSWFFYPQNLLLDILFWSAVYGLPILGYKMLARSKGEG